MASMEKQFDNEAAKDGTVTTAVGERSGYSSESSSISDSKSWDPTKFSMIRKIHIVVAGFTCTFNCNLGSSMPSGALDAISEHFVVTDRVQLGLLNSLYMIGYVVGPLLFGPLSEYIGRRPVLIGTFLGYLVFMLACSGAPNYSALLAFRLLCGLNAAAPTTIIGGLYADVFDNPSERGIAMAFYMAVTTVGPYIGPLISGFSSQLSWRWPFWIASLIASVGLPLVLMLPETYAPILHNKQVHKRRKEGSKSNTEGQQEELKAFNVRKIFLRPATLIATEPILLSTALYLSLIYAIMYLMFQAYPIVFQQYYGLSAGIAGLAYIPMVIGSVFSFIAFFIFSWYRDSQERAGVAWAQRELYRRLPLACIASPCMVISLFWLGWTTFDSISWIVPTIGGFFFAFGSQLLFMGMVNYLTDVFRQNSASALGAAASLRSIFAICVPLAADSMYDNLGIHWAPSLLGFLTLAMGVIPFVFIRYNDWLVRHSKAATEAFGTKK